MLTELQKQETLQVLRQHVRRYPAMEPADAVKLLYQNEFAGGHLIADEAACRERLRQECRQTLPEARGAEPLGNGIVRLHLSDVRYHRISPDSATRCFIATAKLHRGNGDAFHDKLRLLEQLAAEGGTPFPPQALDGYLREYRANGCPPASHSPAFRARYRPAYRIVSAGYPRLLPLIQAADALQEKKRRVIVALDGRCASGKTTAAALLSVLWGAPVVHMDDFFLPPNLRTPERFSQPGGNVHYERFAEEVLPGLNSHKGFVYRRFDCASMEYAEPISVAPASVVIVEGAYSLHPVFGDYADITAFFDVEPGEQLRRIERRNGSEVAEVFRKRWIPLEEEYLAAVDLEQKTMFRVV